MKQAVGLNLFVAGHQPSMKDVVKHVRDRVLDLFGFASKHDALVRVESILEMSQTLILYFLLSIGLGIVLNNLFPKFDPEESTSKLWGMAILQIIANGIVIFFMEKIVNLVPFMFHFYKPYRPRQTVQTRIGESIALSMILFATQDDLIARINEIQSRATGKGRVKKIENTN